MDNKKIKILIVDDDEEARDVYADIFKREGFEVLEASDGVEGLDKATKDSPDIVFTGIIMPRMDGFMLKDALSKNVSTANIPVMMSSHMGREEDRRKAESLGIKEFIIQGMVSPREVVEKVNVMFGAGKYEVKFDIGDPGIKKLAQDFHFNEKFECENCSARKVLSLKIANINKKEFLAEFICPDCGK